MLWGESLGSGVAVHLAARQAVAGVILEAPFTSVAAAAQHHYPFMPAAMLVRDRFDSLSRIGRVRAPLLVLHGERDMIVPVRHGRALLDAATAPKEGWFAPQAGHENLAQFGALDAAIDFIERRVCRAPAGTRCRRRQYRRLVRRGRIERGDRAMPDAVKKVVLAYSGGLDTSVILRWLQETYRCEVVTFTADLGQGEELEPARKKAELLGAAQIFVDDLREEFVRDFVFPMFRANALYEGAYLLGTSIARPLIAKRQIEIAREVGADAVAHGATGKGNDQVRFELGYYALAPDIKVIAPWREWDLTSRTRLLDYAEQHQIPIARDKRGEAPFSIDANLLHISAEGKVLEDPWAEPEEFVYSRTVAPEAAPDTPAICRDRVRARRPGRGRRRSAVAGGVADAAQRIGRQARHRPARSGREPLCRHEVARRLRDARAARSCSRRIAASRA